MHLVFDLIGPVLIVLSVVVLILTVLMARKASTTRAEYRAVSCAEFADLDLAYYQWVQDRLAYYGFRVLGDVQNLTMSRWARYFVRHMASSDGLIMAEFYAPRLRGWVRVCQMVNPMASDMRTIELTTEFSDGTFLCTVNTAGSDMTTPPPGICLSRYPRNTLPEYLLAYHQRGTQDLLAQKPGVTMLPHLTVAEDIAACHRMQDLRAAQYRRSGFLGMFIR